MPVEPTPNTGGQTAYDPNIVEPINIPMDQVPSLLANAPHPDQLKTYPVVINGKAESWTLEKLTAEAQTGAAGREAFQQAAESRKVNAKALAIQEDLEQVFHQGDMDAFRRLGAQYGVPGDEVERIAAGTFGAEDAEEDEEDGEVVDQYLEESNTRSRPEREGPVEYANLSPDVQRVLREAEKQRIDVIVKTALDKDEVIAYNIEAQTPEGRLAIRDYVDEKIRGRLDSFAGDFGDGSRILAEVLPEIRTHLQALGTPSPRTLTGLGHAPGGGDTEVYPTKLPEHVPSTEGDAFEQNILETMAYHQAQAERGKH